MARRLFALVLVAGVSAACSSGAEPPPTLAGFTSTTISIDGHEMAVAVADTPETRRQGLMGVTDLGGLDGMLFVWDADTGAAFWMKDTLIPLDIAFFGVGRGFVDRLTMEPCTTDSCPLYSAAGLYRYAVEAPAGDLGFAAPGSKLVIESDG
jgi:hypothetical protein